MKARVFPAILTILPVLLFSHFYLYKIIPELLDSIMLTKVIGDVSVIVVFVYLVIQVSRFISKKLLQDNIFKNELHFPTTDYLLYSNKKYTKEHKEVIRNKIKEDFGIELFSENLEGNNDEESRKKINEAVKLIRSKVKDGRLLLQHNIEYGFIRNLTGGLIISLPFSIFDIIFFVFKSNNIAIVISAILLLFYILLFVLHRKIIKYYAYNYADVLFNEYLSI